MSAGQRNWTWALACLGVVVVFFSLTLWKYSPKELTAGAEIKILKDLRYYGAATGKVAEYVKNDEGWTLYDQWVRAEAESSGVPKGYAVWDPKAQEWPGTKTAVKSENPVFRLGDGSLIKGNECYWEPVDKRVQKWLEQKSKDEWWQIMSRLKEAALKK